MLEHVKLSLRGYYLLTQSFIQSLIHRFNNFLIHFSNDSVFLAQLNTDFFSTFIFSFVLFNWLLRIHLIGNRFVYAFSFAHFHFIWIIDFNVCLSVYLHAMFVAMNMICLSVYKKNLVVLFELVKLWRKN